MTESEKIRKAERNAKSLISSGSEFPGTITAAALSLVGTPLAVIGGAAAGLTLSKVMNYVASEVYERVSGHRGAARAGLTYATIVTTLSARINKGEKPRSDTFFKSDVNRSDAEELLEGTLLSARDSYQEKKLRHYGYFFSNIVFESSIDAAQANFLLRLADRLSYRQFILLHLFQDKYRSKLRDQDYEDLVYKGKLNDGEDALLSEIYDLYQQSLIRRNDQQAIPSKIGIWPAKMAQEPLGVIFDRLFELEKISKKEIEKLFKQVEYLARRDYLP